MLVADSNNKVGRWRDYNKDI